MSPTTRNRSNASRSKKKASAAPDQDEDRTKSPPTTPPQVDKEKDTTSPLSKNDDEVFEPEKKPDSEEESLASKSKTEEDDEEEEIFETPKTIRGMVVEELTPPEDETDKPAGHEEIALPAPQVLTGEADPTVPYKKATEDVFYKDNEDFLGVCVAPDKSILEPATVHRFATGSHFRCNEPENNCAMQLLSQFTKSVEEVKGTTRNYRSVRPDIKALLEKEVKRMSIKHPKHSNAELPSRAFNVLFNLMKGFVTNQNEVNENLHLKQIRCLFCMSRLGKNGHKQCGIDACEFTTAHNATHTWLANQMNQIGLGKHAAFPLIGAYLLKGHYQHNGLHKHLELTPSQPARIQHDMLRRNKGDQTNETVHVVERRQEIIDEMEDYVDWYSKNEATLWQEKDRLLPTCAELEEEPGPTPNVGSPLRKLEDLNLKPKATGRKQKAGSALKGSASKRSRR